MGINPGSSAEVCSGLQRSISAWISPARTDLGLQALKPTGEYCIYKVAIKVADQSGRPKWPTKVADQRGRPAWPVCGRYVVWGS